MSEGKCAGGFELDGFKPCKECGAEPGDVCHRHYQQLADKVRELEGAPQRILDEYGDADIGDDAWAIASATLSKGKQL